MAKPKVYKFTFYGCVHPMSKNRTRKDIIEEVDNAIWCCDSMSIIKDLEVEEYKLKIWENHIQDKVKQEVSQDD
jgi:hypothetical protein